MNSLLFPSVALLATVIIWLYDFNNQGVLNMTPAERELAHKALLSTAATSINDDTENDEGQSKFLARNDENDEGNSSDTEPLLN